MTQWPTMFSSLACLTALTLQNAYYCVYVYEGVLCGGGYGGGCLCASIYMSARSAMLSMSPLD